MIKFYLTGLFWFAAAFCCKAQDIFTQSILQKGDQFHKNIYENTNTIWSQAQKALDINYSLAISQRIHIDDVTEEGYSISVYTILIQDSIDSKGQHAVYNSEELKDTSSVVEKFIRTALEQPVRLHVNKSGKITSIFAHPQIDPTFDSLLVKLGIILQPFKVGSTIGLWSGFTNQVNQKLGYTWSDTDTVHGKKSVTNFKLTSTDKWTATVEFNMKSGDSLANTHTNGLLIIDRISGLVIQKSTKCITSGYEVINGTLCLVDQMSARSEFALKQD